MGYALKTTCDFGEVWEETAPGRDAFSNLMAWPVKKVGHFRADHDGDRWYGNYFPCNEHLKNPAVAAEMAGVCRYLLEERFAGNAGGKNYFSSAAPIRKQHSPPAGTSTISTSTVPSPTTGSGQSPGRGITTSISTRS